MITNREKALLHIYADAAGLEQRTYRILLQATTGCRSAADRAMTQAGFEAAMAALEGLLFDRVARGLCPDPIAAGSGRIRSRTYWRDRLPKSGRCNSRQARALRKLWSQLCPLLEPRQRNAHYLAGILSHSSTGDTCVAPSLPSPSTLDDLLPNLTAAQAWRLHEALKDRLAHAIKKHPTPEGLPF